MRRRRFLELAGGATAAAWPLVVRTQPATPVIGLLGGATATGWASFVAAFRRGLGEAGFLEHRNLAIEARWADGQYDRLPALAVELIQRQVAVIAAFTTPAALAAKAATFTIPVVFTTISNPVQIGLVASLSRPGGNVTGVTTLNVEIGSKQLELIHEVIAPSAAIALLINPANPNAETLSGSLQAAARTLGRQLHILRASTEGDIDTTFARLLEVKAGGLVIGGDTFLNSRSAQLATLALRHAVPAIFSSRAFAAAGGLTTYEGSASDSYRQAGGYVARILKGERPADLPVVQSTKVELIVNLKTAKALGLNLPQSLLGRADEVIE
jgi:putative ABC transport system substrate-binding protein